MRIEKSFKEIRRIPESTESQIVKGTSQPEPTAWGIVQRDKEAELTSPEYRTAKGISTNK
ncbi:MAG: hypothetical protein ABSB56_04405 [Nitrososphaerales archaeon]